MVNFSSLVPKTRLGGAVSGLEILTVSFLRLAAAREEAVLASRERKHGTANAVSSGENKTWKQELCGSLHSKGLRKGTGVCEVEKLVDLSHHRFEVSQSSTQLGVFRVQTMNYGSLAKAQLSNRSVMKDVDKQAISNSSESNGEFVRKYEIGENVSKKDKMQFLVNTLLDMKDSKEAVYGALDAWVAWERNFPIASLKRVLFTLEKEQQWHRVIQVIKWMLSKGQGNTMGTCGQLIRALEMDHRAEEAHKIWEKKIGKDLHSVPWQLCRQMIGIYYRNNMLQELVKLFKGLEAFDRKPPEKSIVQRVADAYEMLGLVQEKERVLEKYKELFAEKRKKSGNVKHESTSGNSPDARA